MPGSWEVDQAPLMTPSEVAVLFGVGSKTVGRWARTGKLKCVRTIGGHFRFDAAEVQALLEKAGNMEVTG
jgi:excisionase family DNA binding protein